MEGLELIKRKAVQIISEEDLDKKLKSGKKLTKFWQIVKKRLQ